MIELYNKVCTECSQHITKRYSTSFSLGIRLFHKELRDPIYSIYGFVRFADEIVDTFHDYDKALLLDKFKSDTHAAIAEGISLNPVLHAFQAVVNEYDIGLDLIDAFLYSMSMDLEDQSYNRKLYEKYIYGSAEVVGLMCLKVFLPDKPNRYEELKPTAMALGSAFQKVNFLRDIKDDYENKGRTYFPDVDLNNFSESSKREIEMDIDKDFQRGMEGIRLLPKSSRLGVFIAYIFYHNLFQKIRRTNFLTILNKRVKIKNRKKAYLLAKYSLKNSLNLI